MRSFVVETSATPDMVIDTPTYLLARDEDCENSFHSTADFVSLYCKKYKFMDIDEYAACNACA